MGCCKGKKAVLDTCVGRSQPLAYLVEYADGSVVSKTILDRPTGTITLFAFDEGQQLSEHTAPFDAVVQIVEGTAQLTIGGVAVMASAGELVIMPANVPHSVAAVEKFKMLLTMIRE